MKSTLIENGKSLALVASLSAVGMTMAFGYAGPAAAQSSVTLFGVADEGLTFSTNAGGKRQYALTSGNEGQSRWGLKGTEDLGGGLSTIFTIEGGFNGSNGTSTQGGALFGRQAFVGLSSNNLGTLTLGRQYAITYEYVGIFTAGGSWALTGAGYGAHPADLDDMDGSQRINNAVKYKSPTFMGFNFGAMYSFGGVAGDVSRNSYYSAAVSYANGPVSLGAAYSMARNPNYSVFGTNASASTTASNMSGPVISGLAGAGSLETAGVGGSYQIGPATLAAAYTHSSFNSLGATAVTGINSAALGKTAVFNIGEVSVRYLLTPALMLGAAYEYTAAGGLAGRDGARYNQVDLGVDYYFSKRTDVYAMAVYQMASGYDSTGKKAVAVIAYSTPSTSNRQLISVVGVRHRF
ncbi:Outer membrane porin protein [Paraburkholderia hiiakae]|uniref:Outer membrane porin protein n=1 Tax=Paraburkholderia hiiakae TaxID=1081782 RepID=A0ABM8NZL8_9BURK|nr:porin [Paraburkholderia hiiakae]CAD6550797.1 Outer membrane porin protein [Paraburkholderia hiiakae]